MQENRKKAAAAARLKKWQDILRRDETAWQSIRDRLDRQEALLRGSAKITRKDGTAAQKDADHVRNIIAEIIETEVDSTIPAPKVQALREQDEPLARKIEDMLRNELDRLPMEVLNDLQERIVPTHGGDFFFVDWDHTMGTHTTVGDTTVTEVHPRRFVPQAGVYELEDMEHWFLKLPRTEEYIRRKYGVDVAEETEEDQTARSNVEVGTVEGVVTQNIAYYRNGKGGIGRYSWVMDTELEDLEDCQMRHIHICQDCGKTGDGVRCTECGGVKFRREVQEYEELTEDIQRPDGTVISALEQSRDEFGNAATREVSGMSLVDLLGSGALMPQLTAGGDLGAGVYGVQTEPVMRPRQVPCYRPNLYPLVLRRNVSMAGQLLGGSDVDAMEDAQMAANKLSTKINKKLMSGGSFVTKPSSLKFEFSDEDGKVLNLETMQQLEMIQVRNMQVDITADMAFRREVYDEAREQIGITDSFQGRKDPTATSGKAKEFAAAQAAGRLESKRVMKQAAYQKLFELLFKWKLAYADEPRPVVSFNENGDKEYGQFNRWDFLEIDAAGQAYWNDNFLFSCDTAAPLANRRENMWQELRGHRQEGALGDPTKTDNLILYWGIMEQLHYPLAGTIKQAMEKKKQQEEEQAAQAAMQAQMMAEMQSGVLPGGAAGLYKPEPPTNMGGGEVL